MIILCVKNRKFENGFYNYELHYYDNGKIIVKHEHENNESAIYGSFIINIKKRFDTIFLRNDYDEIEYYNVNYISNIRDVSLQSTFRSMFDVVAFGKTHFKNILSDIRTEYIKEMINTIIPKI